MLRLKAFRPTNEKIVKIQLHPTHPWMVTADDSDRVSVWNWEHRQVVYELKAGGVDERRLVGAKLEKLAEGETESKGKPTEAIRGGSVKQVNFYDDDVRFWQLWHNRSAAAEAPTAVHTSAFSSPAPSTKGRHFLVICCLNKAIFLDLVTMRGRDVPKQELDNKSLLCMEFLYRTGVGDGPLVAFGASDGVIRVLSMMTWKLVRRYTGGHKGSISCLMSFMAASGEVQGDIRDLSSGYLAKHGVARGVLVGGINKSIKTTRGTVATSKPKKASFELCQGYKRGGREKRSCKKCRREVVKAMKGITMRNIASRYMLAKEGIVVRNIKALLVSGASDGLLIIWSADHGQDSRELVPKLSLKAHDGGVVAVELSRVMGGAPQLITIGADKTLAIWDTVSFKELRRIKPVPKLACHSVASWCHPRAPNLDILTCVKDSHIWAIEHPTYSALTRPLCELTSVLPPNALAPNKKLRVYCMVTHTLQPHLVATGTNIGVIICEFDARSLPPVAPLLTPADSREHSAVFVIERELKLLNFQLNNSANPSLGNNSSLSETGRPKGDFFEPLPVKQGKKHISTPVPHDSYSVLSVSSSGKYLAIVWPDIPYFSVYKVSDWSIVDSGSARLLAWDTCRDRFAILESTLPPRLPIIPKDDGTSNILMRSVGARSEPVIGLRGGALLGVAYRTSRRVSPIAATAISTIQSMPLSGYGSSVSSFTTYDDGFSSNRPPTTAAPQNFQLYSWETFQPVGDLLPQPEWTAWDQTVEYCAFAYQQYIVISSLRPQYRYLGDVAIPYATSAVWHRRQLFVATPTTIEIVFVDAGIAQIDIETRKMKEEQKMKEAQAKAVAEHGELALISVEGPQSAKEERIALRPPMLQVVRLASFQHAPSVPPFLTLPKQSRVDGDDSWTAAEERKAGEVAVGGGGVSVAVTRFPMEQKRPVGPLVVVGVKDGVLWLIDRYMCAHALSLSHPGIRCRCLAAYGDAVSAVKWASRLGREHHDDLAQFMLGMGYATEALHLPGISKRLEFDLAMKSNDLKRALHCLLTMSNSRDIGQDDTPGLGLNDILNLSDKKQEKISDKKQDMVEGVQGIVKFAKEFLDLIDAADATAQSEIAREALKRLATAGSVKGALEGHELRGLALRLANHGELTRLSGLVNNLVTLGLGREAAFAGAVLGDNALMEKAWQDTGMLAEAVLHSHAHGRPTLKNLVQAWNQALQREIEPTPSQKTDAAAAFLASLEEPKLTSLADAGKKAPIEILPPGMMSLNAPISIQKKPASAAQNSQQPPEKQLALEAPPTTTAAPESATQQPESTPASVTDPPPAESTSSDSTPAPVASPPQQESGETTVDDGVPTTGSAIDGDPNVNGETSQAEASTSNPATPEVPPPPVAAEVLETSTPTTAAVPTITTVPSNDPFI
ncbi:hypothetical protein ACSQ67_002009 [Phaseolus vulgaris]